MFLRLGLTSFGGPVAHLGYFRAEFVARRRWLDEAAFAELIALCQMLPGPTSSQVGFAIGLGRAGWLGGIAAWTGFTLPSAVALVLFALETERFAGPIQQAVLHGLQLVAVAIVAQAVWGMARTLCPDRTRATLAGLAACFLLLEPSPWTQIAAIAAGAVLGTVLCRSDPAKAGVSCTGASPEFPAVVTPSAGWIALGIFIMLALGLPWLALAAGGQAIRMASAFYRSGALVFGGGHVVLPLLQDAVVGPGWVTSNAFLAGYGVTQAVPGPLFTFAAYLGALSSPVPHGVGGAAIALFSIFLPGLLLVTAVLPFWQGLRQRVGAQAAMAGINAVVVGILGAALYDPIWTSSVHTGADFSVALIGFVLLLVWKAPPVLVVALGSLMGLFVGLMA